MAGGSQKAEGRAQELAGLREIFETIRERATYALQRLAASEEVKSLRRKCSGCGHIKSFTRKVPADQTSAVGCQTSAI